MPEALLLVGVILVRRPGLDVVAVVERFEQPVEMGQGAEAQPCGVEGVHLRDTLLGQVRGRAQAQLLRLVESPPP